MKLIVVQLPKHSAAQVCTDHIQLDLSDHIKSKLNLFSGAYIVVVYLSHITCEVVC